MIIRTFFYLQPSSINHGNKHAFAMKAFCMQQMTIMKGNLIKTGSIIQCVFAGSSYIVNDRNLIIRHSLAYRHIV